jgi:outer membrane protein assembly factor BamA
VQQFHVEDSAVTLQSIDFSDALAKSDRHIADRLPDIVGQPYSRARIEIFEFEQVRPIYLQHAFMRVKFGPVAATFPANAPNPLAGGVGVAAPIDPGPAYQFGGVTWSGNSIVSTADLDSLLQMHVGDPANGTEIEGTWERVNAKCAQAGLLSADVDPIQRFDDKAARVLYEVRIKEGPQFHMNNLVLTGLSVEGERRVRQAFPIPQGAIFDKTAFLVFMDKGLRAAFTGLPVHYPKIGSFLQLDPEKAKVDVLLDFQ